jgi:membrane associated rhomboid family serine protease
MAASHSSSQLPPWLRPVADRLSPTIRNLVLVMGVPWLVYILAAPFRGLADEYLVLGPGVMNGQVWQIVTAMFVDRNPLAFLNLLGLWFVGAAIERTLGRRRFLIVFFATGLAANLAIALFSAWWGRWMLLSGCGDSVLGLFVGLGVIHGPAQVRLIWNLVMPARILAGLFVVLSLLFQAMNHAWTAIPGTLVAVGLAYYLCGGRGRDFQDLWSWVHRRIGRKRMQVLDGGKTGKRRDSFN